MVVVSSSRSDDMSRSLGDDEGTFVPASAVPRPNSPESGGEVNATSAGSDSFSHAC